MGISNNMKRSVENKDMEEIRMCLFTCIMLDGKFKTGDYDENLSYIKRMLGVDYKKIFQPHDESGGKTLDFPNNEESLEKLKGDLIENFSEERLMKMREIARELIRKGGEHIGNEDGMGSGNAKRYSERDNMKKGDSKNSGRSKTYTKDPITGKEIYDDDNKAQTEKKENNFFLRFWKSLKRFVHILSP